MVTDLAVFINLDHENRHYPLYRQIYDSIRTAILSGALRSAVRLPPSRELAAQLSVSRMTVVNAYDQLLAEGYLEGKAGSGTFVAAEIPDEYHTAPRRENTVPRRHKRRLRLSDYGEALKTQGEAIRANEAASKLVPFQHGLPALDKFPFEIWERILAKYHRTSLRKLVSKSGPLGYEPLRIAVAEHLRSARGVACQTDEVVITNGAQQGLDLIARILLRSGDRVWMEDPGYLGAREAFGAAGAAVMPVRSDMEGFDLNYAIKRYGSAELTYVTPSHQFPLGGAMTLARRIEVLEWADRSGAIIVEDDYDSEFRYQGRPLASMQGLDRDGRVIYLGTFSKTLFSALRLGCMVVPSDLTDIFATARLTSDLHSPLIEQAALAEFIRDGHFARHVRRMRKLYAERQEILLNAVGKYLNGVIKMNPASSGMHLVGWLPEGVSDIAFSNAAAAKGVRVAPVSDYAMRKPKRGGLLFGYAGFDERQIAAAVGRLAEIDL